MLLFVCEQRGISFYVGTEHTSTQVQVFKWSVLADTQETQEIPPPNQVFWCLNLTKLQPYDNVYDMLESLFLQRGKILPQAYLTLKALTHQAHGE